VNEETVETVDVLSVTRTGGLGRTSTSLCGIFSLTRQNKGKNRMKLSQTNKYSATY